MIQAPPESHIARVPANLIFNPVLKQDALDFLIRPLICTESVTLSGASQARFGTPRALDSDEELRMKRKKLGEILQDRGQISAEDLHQLFEEQKGKIVRLGELILEHGLVDKPSLVKALEEVSRVPYLDCVTIQCDDAVLQSIPKPMAVRLEILPVGMDQSRLIVVMAEPQNIATINELRFKTGKDISPRLGFRAEILSAIVRNYDHFEGTATERQASAANEGVSGSETEMEFISTSTRQSNRDAIQEIQAELHQKKTPAVRLVSEIIQKAMEKQASDIHIEPQAAATVVRIRVDGVLRELESVPRGVQNSLVSPSRFFPTWISESAALHRTGVSWSR